MTLIIYGDPVAQGRPRFTTAGGYAHAYDPDKSSAYKEKIQIEAKKAMRGKSPLEGDLSFCLRVYRPIPKRTSKKRAALAEAGDIRPTTRPDLDNYLKGVLDALNSICWRDDSQIVAYHEPFGKYYSATPRIEVEVLPVIDGRPEPCD